jgi:hypothetical protein
MISSPHHYYEIKSTIIKASSYSTFEISCSHPRELESTSQRFITLDFRQDFENLDKENLMLSSPLSF